MQLLLIGGSGRVGEMITPHIAASHSIRVLDIAPPKYVQPIEYVRGSSDDYRVLKEAMRQTDAVVYLAMGPLAEWGSPDCVSRHFDAGPKGLYLSLRAAAETGVTKVVYLSSMSVFSDNGLTLDPDLERYPEPDSTAWYGLIKRLAETVAQAAAAEYQGMTVVALRLFKPLPDDVRQQGLRLPNPELPVAASDVAAAVMAAVTYPRPGFHAYPISGDAAGLHYNQSEVRRELGWYPRASHV